MKVALVMDRYHPRKGGAERSLSRIVEALLRRGHEVHLCAMSWDEPAPGLSCHLVPARGWPRWRRDLDFARRSAVTARELHPDITLGVRHVLHADVFLARGGSYLQTCEAGDRAAGSPLRRALRRMSLKRRAFLALERRLFHGPNPPLVIAPSRMAGSSFTRDLGLDPARVLTVHTGVDPERFAPASPAERLALRSRLGVPPERILGLFVGHNFRLKGLPELLRAWRLLEPGRFTLAVAGRGRSPAGTPPNVLVLGDQADTRALYRAADVLIHPTFYDPFSRVVIEAMACGVPVITTVHNGAAELIRDGREGFVIGDPRDSAALSERIRFFTDAARARSMGAAARQRALETPESAFLDATVAAIEREAERRARAAA